jgi:MPBQ/MSBQ methyltransferase
VSPSGSSDEDLIRHYVPGDLATAVLAAIEKSGRDPRRLTLEDLAPMDEFHVRGREATLELARAADLLAGQRVLDVGSGLGGPSRCLTRTFACRVTGVDRTGEYCRVAAMLAARVGLSHLVTYLQGDALDLPFRDGAFDVVWTQHAAMNIRDKPRLYGEMSRVLRPRGVLALYDVLAGPSGPVRFPVPWGRGPATSFLVAPSELRQLLEEGGFAIERWDDTTAAALAWYASLSGKSREPGAPALGLHVVLGPEFALMARNLRQGLGEGRVILAQVVARKSG